MTKHYKDRDLIIKIVFFTFQNDLETRTFPYNIANFKMNKNEIEKQKIEKYKNRETKERKKEDKKLYFKMQREKQQLY